jgi:AcrR family transcriptional regulator
MPPQVNFTKDRILKTAFEIVRREGLGALSARNIAQQLHCSTRPIYTAFQSMPELVAAVIKTAREYALNYLLQGSKENEPFLTIGLQYFRFAQEEKELFKLVFMSDRSGIDLEKMLASSSLIIERMKQDQHLQELPDETLRRIFRDMWIYTHGLITLTYKASLEDAEKFVHDCLFQMGRTVIEWEHYHQNRSVA